MPETSAWTAGPAPSASVVSQGWTAGPAPVPTFRQSDQTPNEVDPNTLGTFVKHLWAGVNPVQIGQMLPWPKALGGSGVDNPLNPKKIADDLHAVKQDADARLAKGDYVGALSKYVESVVPILGPMMSHMGDQAQQGKWSALAGDTTALAAQAAAPRVLEAVGGRRVVPPVTRESAPVQFAAARDIPLDAATVSDNLAVKGAQAIADRSLGGSVVATPANAVRAAAMDRVGGELAAETHPAPVTPEQAGASLRDALTKKMGEHGQSANVAYDTLRKHEGNFLHADEVPVPAAENAEWLRNATRTTGDVPKPAELRELRRMAAEMDARQYEGRNFSSNEQFTAKGSGGKQYDISAGHGGARVVEDIVAAAEGSSASQGDIVTALKSALDTGRFSPLGRAALEVARKRLAGESFLEPAELPPSYGDVPQKTQIMLLPVDIRAAKAGLQPIYDQMMRQMPVTQQQASVGLKALENIVRGPDFAPLSQVDRDLSAIKAIARERGGLAKKAVSELDAAVTGAAAEAGPDVLDALKQGRAATVRKYAVADVLDRLNAEPVRTVKALTAPADSAIEQLRAVVAHVPEQAQVLARAKLEDILASPQAVADWRKLGTETKRILFPKAGLANELDQFFALKDRISKTNINPSGSGYVASLGAQGAMLWYDPVHAIPLQLTGAAISKAMRSPVFVQALTRGMRLPNTAPVAARAAATAALVNSARHAGVVIDFPKAADSTPTADTSR